MGLTLAVLSVVLGLGAAELAVLAGRVDRLDVVLPDGPGTTWVLVGLDFRAHLPAGTTSRDFGTTAQVPGSRADVILVVHVAASGTTMLSVPRDLVVAGAATPGRLALSWLDGPQSTVDALCGIGIPTDHLVTVDLGGFAAVVDAAGGLEVDVPAPVRDPQAGLELPSAGRQHVDGRTALAMVRSRHPEELVDGAWTPATVDPDGRAAMAGTVLGALTDTVRRSAASPWRAHALAWSASAALTMDRHTGLADLGSLLRADLGRPVVLPVGEPVGGTVTRFATPETHAAVEAAGMSCAG
ncbi:LytR family transcriptional attenuator [Blastococcus colisei]|uniref:LytR family transcriptional attenuator n=1 Tax=Blastococcus colisei TaxID=1564162 RepID=A0A543PCS7_9ACTN|nr:LCP family protein [Blastococcus colisei]TQN41881.1 LytR family transcriptional attenuator [Blastococcus colisei]